MSTPAPVQFTTIESLRDSSRKSITNPDTGHSFLIRKLAQLDLWAEGLIMLAESGAKKSDAKNKAAGMTPEQRRDLVRLERAAVIDGLVSIVVEDPEAGQPATAGAIALRDIPPSDRTFIAQEVLEFSGLLLFRAAS